MASQPLAGNDARQRSKFANGTMLLNSSHANILFGSRATLAVAWEERPQSSCVLELRIHKYLQDRALRTQNSASANGTNFD